MHDDRWLNAIWHSHVLWAGIAAKLMGFKTMFMTCFELREKVMDVLQAISGNRVNYSMNRIGGVNRDIDDPQPILKMVEALELEMARTVIPIFTTSSTAPLALRRHRRTDHREGYLLRRRRSSGARLGSASGYSPRRALRRLLRDGIRRSGPARRRRQSAPSKVLPAMSISTCKRSWKRVC